MNAFTDDDLKFWRELGGDNEFEDNVEIHSTTLKALLARLEAVEKGIAVLGEIEYCFQNIWALDRKKFEEQFMPKIKAALDAWRKAKGDEELDKPDLYICAEYDGKGRSVCGAPCPKHSKELEKL